MALTVPVEEIVARNSNGLLGKHESWGRVRLGDVARIQNGATFKSEYFNHEGRGMPLLRIRDVPSDRTAAYYDGPYESALIVEEGDLIIGMDGDFNSALWAGPPALLNQRVCRVDFVAEVLSKRFVFHALQGYLDAVNEVTSSVTVKHLSSRTVADLPLPLPPRAEQDRIVEALEQHGERVDGGASEVRDALRLLRQLRAACLAAAFDQDGVETRELDDLAMIQSGITKSPPKGTDLIAVPYIRTANVQAGYLDLDEIKELQVTEEQRRRYLLETGDVLVLEGGDADKVGRGWIWATEIPGAIHQNHIFAVRPDPERLDGRYLAYFVNAPRARAYFLSNAKQTTNLASINKTQLRALPVPAPSIEAQREIVERLDRELEAVAALRNVIAGRISEVGRLNRSLLSAALRGRLVPQDPSDPPTAGMLKSDATSA